MARPNPPYRFTSGPSGENTVGLRFTRSASGLEIAKILGPVAHSLAEVIGHEPLFTIQTADGAPWKLQAAFFRIATGSEITDIVASNLEGEGFWPNDHYFGIRLDSVALEQNRKSPTAEQRAVRATGTAFLAVAAFEEFGRDHGPIEIERKEQQ